MLWCPQRSSVALSVAEATQAVRDSAWCRLRLGTEAEGDKQRDDGEQDDVDDLRVGPPGSAITSRWRQPLSRRAAGLQSGVRPALHGKLLAGQHIFFYYV